MIPLATATSAALATAMMVEGELTDCPELMPLLALEPLLEAFELPVESLELAVNDDVCEEGMLTLQLSPNWH